MSLQEIHFFITGMQKFFQKASKAIDLTAYPKRTILIIKLARGNNYAKSGDATAGGKCPHKGGYTDGL